MSKWKTYAERDKIPEGFFVAVKVFEGGEYVISLCEKLDGRYCKCVVEDNRWMIVTPDETGPFFDLWLPIPDPDPFLLDVFGCPEVQ